MKTYITTLGCPKNLVDSEATATVLRRAGCELTNDPGDADLLMVGACSFLESSWQETVEEVERLAVYKKGRDGARLVLMGCLPRHRPEPLESTLREVDHFLPTGAHGQLSDLVENWREARPVARTLPSLPGSRFEAFVGRDRLTPLHSAYVKVAEGCNRKCTFCAIPLIRGRMVTRPVAEIAAEVDALVAQGVKEVTLLSQDIVAYRDGADRFPELVEAIAGSGIDWIRIFYVHPAGVTADTIERIFAHPSVCRYLEMPVQHASTRLLERMKRSHDRDHIAGLVSDVRARFPDAIIRSEVIVGFPGETDADFDELVGFVEEFEFDTLGIFPYSAEPGTAAPLLEGRVEGGVIRARVEELSRVQEAISFGRRAALLDRTCDVLVDRAVTEDEGVFDGCGFAGRFYGQALEVDGEVYIEGNEARVGEFVRARITDAGVFDLRAQAVSAGDSTPV